MSDSKPSNPKDLLGSKKAPLSLVPWTLVVCCARALLEGALKYGRFNWRIAGVKASIYLDALKRHIAKWENGQECDPKTQVHHLDNAIACLTIMRDAMLYGKLNDDRPPCPDPDAMARLIDGEDELVAHLKETFKDHNPHQYTIADTRPLTATEIIAADVVNRAFAEMPENPSPAMTGEGVSTSAEGGPCINTTGLRPTYRYHWRDDANFRAGRCRQCGDALPKKE